MSAPDVVSHSLSSRYGTHEGVFNGWQTTDNVPQEAGIPRKLAPTIGISVDPRRQNLSEESLKANVERLKAYKQRLVLFPRKAGHAKAGDSNEKAAEAGAQISYEGKVKNSRDFFPISNKVAAQEGKIADFKSEENAYRKLRVARSDARNQGKREKRAKAAEEEAANAKK